MHGGGKESVPLRRELKETDPLRVERLPEGMLTLSLVGCVSVSILCNIAFGFDVGIVSGILDDLSSNLRLSSTEQEIFAGGLNFISAAGSLLVAGGLLDRFGRTLPLLVASLLLLIGGIIVAAAPNFATLMVGRVMQGLGSGAAWATSSVYISEIAPSKWRGALVCMVDISAVIGLVIGFLANVITFNADDRAGSAEMRWRLGIGLSVIPPAAYCVLHWTLPQSPRWLLRKGRSAEATEVLMRLQGQLSREQAMSHIQDMEAMLKRPEARESSWLESLGCSTPQVHGNACRALIAAGLGFCHQAAGGEAILYFSPRILNQCGRYAFTFSQCTDRHTIVILTLGNGLCKILAAIVAASYVDRIGRRVAMLSSAAAVAFLCLLMALKFVYGWSMEVGAVIIYLSTVSTMLGFGPMTFVVINEMLPLSQRAKVVALSVAVNRLTSGGVALSFLSIVETIGASGAFFLYAALGFGVLCFYYLFVVDVTGRELEDLLADDTGPLSATGRHTGEHVGGGPGAEGAAARRVEPTVSPLEGAADSEQ